ncbi:MAG: GTPase domain-containing protein [Candidatus Lokiarchaeota archaeon]|nr:GTPase domain-containing protein [Candidatus Lokiarchaeota archaeon]
MIFDYKNKTLQVKIVYYGPAMSGKTTSIKSLFSYFNKEDSVKSIDNSVGRTLFFDFGVLNFKGAEWGLKFLIYSATGQDFYASTRPATLNGVDGLIFVVDSQIEFLEHNLRSWNELKTLFGSEFYNIPIIISLNKCDLFTIQDLTQEGFLSNIDYNKFGHISFKKTVAIRGEGVLDSFSELIKFIFPQLKVNLSIIN